MGIFLPKSEHKSSNTKPQFCRPYKLCSFSPSANQADTFSTASLSTNNTTHQPKSTHSTPPSTWISATKDVPASPVSLVAAIGSPWLPFALHRREVIVATFPAFLPISSYMHSQEISAWSNSRLGGFRHGELLAQRNQVPWTLAHRNDTQPPFALALSVTPVGAY